MVFLNKSQQNIHGQFSCKIANICLSRASDDQKQNNLLPTTVHTYNEICVNYTQKYQTLFTSTISAKASTNDFSVDKISYAI